MLSALFCSVSVVFGAASDGHAFFGDPPDDAHPWAVHDQNRPLPKVVTPGTFSSAEQPGKPPADAIVLFDGTEASLANWEPDDKAKGKPWILKDGALECVPKSGYTKSKKEFGDVQLHVEWAAPKKVEGNGQGRGNSGIFLPGNLEVQVLDNYNNPTYADGTAGALYGINPPMVNPLNPPGEFQVVDIVFRRPLFKDGKCTEPGHVTVFINGVLVQDSTPPEGSGGFMGRSKARPYPEKGPLKLQDHGNPVRFRNIWYRELPTRIVEDGSNGHLSPEATMAKRKEIAAGIREDAAKLKDANNPLPELLRLAESLIYEKEDATFQKVSEMAKQFVDGVKQLPADKLGSKRGEIMSLNGAFRYLSTKAGVLPADFAPKTDLEKLIKDQNWK